MLTAAEQVDHGLSHSHLYLAVTCLLLVATPAVGQDQPFCEAGLDTGLGREAFFADWEDDPTGTITFEAGRVEAEVGANPRIALSGGVLVRRGERLAGSDAANYDPDTMSLSLTGQVRYQDPLVGYGDIAKPDPARFDHRSR